MYVCETRHKTKTNKQKKAIQGKINNTDPIINTGGEPMCSRKN